jgi:O-succinylbenzoate synthase
MRLEQLTLRELHMKLVAPFQTSMETTTTRRILLTEVVVDGVVGWGECVAGETPS